MLFKPDPKFDEARKKANVEICMELIRYFQNDPSLRFGQGIVNLFGTNADLLHNAEPEDLLEIIKKVNNETSNG